MKITATNFADIISAAAATTVKYRPRKSITLGRVQRERTAPAPPPEVTASRHHRRRRRFYGGRGFRTRGRLAAAENHAAVDG